MYLFQEQKIKYIFYNNLIMTERIQNAIDVFLDAINKGTLAKGTCCACAIGNLIADKINYQIKNLVHNPQAPNGLWWKQEGFHTGGINYESPLLEMLDFTIEEIVEIEKAFEDNTSRSYVDYNFCSKEKIREDQIKGLKAVVEVMMKFDDVKDDVNEVFTEKAESIPL